MSNEYPSLRQRCLWQTHPTMTGYCIEGRCELCGYHGGLAMVKAEQTRRDED
jgi:hypothetical protein